ncbi:MAG: hypothetical protein NVS3B5_13190 [Sphingomicrobium sp.]
MKVIASLFYALFHGRNRIVMKDQADVAGVHETFPAEAILTYIQTARAAVCGHLAD